MQGLDSLSEEESADFFQSLPSQPRLLARTGPNASPYRPMRRALTPVADSDTIRRWTRSLRQSLINKLSRDVPPLSWTAFLPLRVVSRPYWSDERSNSNNYLFICVAPDTTGWEQAARAARDCRAILPAAGPRPSPGPGQGEAKPAPEPAPDCTPAPAPVPTDSEASASQPVELQDVFDRRFFSPDMSMDRVALSAVNEALLPFLPLPGQNIQVSADASSDPARDHLLPSGSLAGFLRLEDASGRLSDTIYALTSRHVVVQDLYDHQTDIHIHSTSGSNQDNIEICTGAAAAIDRQRVRLRAAQGGLADWIHYVKTRMFENVPQDGKSPTALTGHMAAFLELMEECHSSYIGKVSEGLAALSLRDESSIRTRQVGHVACSAGHGIDTEGAWRDWALVALALPSTEHRAQPGFFTNKVYIGHWIQRVRARVRQMQPSSAGRRLTLTMNGIPDALDKADFLNVRAPHPPMLMQQRSTYVARPVIKRGPVTGLTVGLVSPIEAVVRRPLPGVDVVAVAWAWPVLSFVENPDYDLQTNVFSAPGDVGSLVFDTDGVAVGMVDAGLGANEMPRRCTMDITLMTPINAVFASIKQVTGQTPRMV